MPDHKCRHGFRSTRKLDFVRQKPDSVSKVVYTSIYNFSLKDNNVEWNLVNDFFKRTNEGFTPRSPEQWAQAQDPRRRLVHGFKRVTHCLFDLDGTILDSEERYHKVIKEICLIYGRKYSKYVQAQCYGGTDHEICSKVVNHCRLPITPHELEEKMSHMMKKQLPAAPLQKGVERLLNHLHDNAVPFALATNSLAESVRLHEVARPKIFSLFHHKVCADDPEVLRGKPYPDLYLMAMHRFNNPHLKPRDCLVFEDSLIGVQAAHDAGMQVVLIPRKWNPHQLCRKATLVIKSLQDFHPEQFGLPPFSDKSARQRTSLWNLDCNNSNTVLRKTFQHEKW